MGLFRQEYWSGLPFPSPRDLPNPGTEPQFPALQAESLLSEPQGKPFNSLVKCKVDDYLVVLSRSPCTEMASYLPSGVGLVSARKGEGSEDGDEDPRWAERGQIRRIKAG